MIVSSYDASFLSVKPDTKSIGVGVLFHHGRQQNSFLTPMFLHSCLHRINQRSFFLLDRQRALFPSPTSRPLVCRPSRYLFRKSSGKKIIQSPLFMEFRFICSGSLRQGGFFLSARRQACKNICFFQRIMRTVSPLRAGR